MREGVKRKIFKTFFANGVSHIRRPHVSERERERDREKEKKREIEKE